MSVDFESEEVDFSTEILEDNEGNIIDNDSDNISDDIEEDIIDEEVPEDEEEITEDDVEEDDVEEKTEEIPVEDNLGEAKSTPVTVNIDGMAIELSSLDEAKKIIDRANGKVDTFDIMSKDLNIDKSDVKLVSMIKAGDKDAVMHLLKASGIDIDELIYHDTPSDINLDYQPTQPSEVESIITNIQANPVENEKFTTLIDNTNEGFVNAIVQSPEIMNVFRGHVNDGTAEKIMPHAKRMAAIEGIPLFDAYAKVGKELASKGEVKSTKTAPIPKAKSKAAKAKTTVVDYHTMLDEDFYAEIGEEII